MKKIFKIPTSIILFLFLGIMLFMGSSCEQDNIASAEQMQTDQTNAILSEVNREIGLPNIVNFQQKKLMKMVYELSDQEDLICYAYIKSDYQGKLVFIGKCIGFGVPFSAQYTNPEKIAYRRTNVGVVTIPQADPNALYMPTSSSATWLLMIDPETNSPRPVYLEPEIVVSPFPLHEL